MTNLRQAAQRALEAMSLAASSHDVMLLSDPPQEAWKARGVSWKLSEAMNALKQALAEPEQEPAPGYCKHCKQYTIEEPLPAEPQTTHWEGCETVHPECKRPEPVLVSPTTFIQTVLYKEDTIGRPTIWTQWPNEEKNT